MKLIADKNKCIGAGQCVMVAAHLFGQDADDGLVVLLNKEPSESERGAADLAVRSCPSLALTLLD